MEPDEELQVATLDPPLPTLFVAREGWLVAAVELISPRNKDRKSSQSNSTSRYAGYLRGGVNLVLIDFHARPYAFSFADGIARDLGISQAPLPTPHAVAYRVGEPLADSGSFLAVWRRPFVVGEKLPTIALPLNVHQEVVLDLEQTYSEAARLMYMV